MLPRSWVSTASALVLLLLGTVLPPVAVAAGDGVPGHAPERVDAYAGRTVTLVTGDKVRFGPTVDGEPTLTVEPRLPGAAGGFGVHRTGDGTYVVPDDVQALVPSVLDRRLFNVTALVEMGYDDAESRSVPLIVQTGSAPARVAAETPLEVTDRLSSVAASVAELDKGKAARFGAELADLPSASRSATASALGGAQKIWLDAEVTVSSGAAPTYGAAFDDAALDDAVLDHYVEQVRAPVAWQAGLDGEGVTVAVLDTGVDDGHPALAGAVTAERNFSDAPSAEDGHGHGTHVASLAAGSGAGSGGARQGIAPAADVISGKVLDDAGEGRESWVIAGMEWAAASGADVVNLSLGGRPTSAEEPTVQALETLTAETDALFVVAAGNRGGFTNDPFTIDAPGTAPSALTVGAATADDGQAFFSSEGPTDHTFLLKPDVLAPGVELLGARAGARTEDLYVAMSGTSMATPVTAGAAALLRQQHPDWPAAQVKTRIMNAADGNRWYTAWTHGSGRLDLAAATRPPLSGDLANLDVGYLRHPDDAVQERVLSVTNPGSEPITVDVHDTLANLHADPAPVAALTARPASLVVPAGGTASTTLTLDPGELPDGYWQGVITLGDETSTLLRLPVGAYDEPPRYDLDVIVLDRDGDPWDPAAGDRPDLDPTLQAFNLDNGHLFTMTVDSSGRAGARVDAGRYTVFGRVVTPAGRQRPSTTTVTGTTALDVQADRHLVLDARRGVRLREPVLEGEPSRPTGLTGLTYQSSSGEVSYVEGASWDSQEVRDGRVFVTPTRAAPAAGFQSSARWSLVPARAHGPAAADGYELEFHDDRLDASLLQPRLDRQEVRDLARVEQVLRPFAAAGDQVLRSISNTRGLSLGFASSEPLTGPRRRTVLTTADPDVLWTYCLPMEINLWYAACGPTRTLKPGRTEPVELAGAVHPGVISTAMWEYSLLIDVGQGDGTHRMQLVDPAVTERSRLELRTADGDLVGTSDADFGWFALPAPQGRYRVTHDRTLRPDTFHAAARSRTVWEVAVAPDEVPPFLDVEFGPRLDVAGFAAARRPLRLDLAFARLGPEGEGYGRVSVARARLWWSTNGGKAWHELRVHSGGNGHGALLPAAALRRGDRISLRVWASDRAGNTIDQRNVDMIPVR